MLCIICKIELEVRDKMKEYFELFISFAKIGAFTFGGGYAMLPLLQKEVVEKKKWTTNEEIMDYYAVGQCTPGIIAVNTATFIGYYQKGILGAIIATFGIIFPSIVIILLIAGFLQNFSDLPLIQHALAGIRVAVCVLVLNAIIKMFHTGVKDMIGICIFSISLFVAYLSIIPTLWIIIASAICGIIIQSVRLKKEVNKL